MIDKFCLQNEDHQVPALENQAATPEIFHTVSKKETPPDSMNANPLETLAERFLEKTEVRV